MLTKLKTCRTKLRGLALASLVLLPSLALSQIELGARFGLSTYMGDLAPRPVPSESSPAVGLFMRANMNANWKLRAGFTYGNIKGRDRDMVGDNRTNLNFKTTLMELAFEVEYDIFPFLPGSANLTFAPYIFAGIAGFRFDPKAQMADRTYLKLREIGTEGQYIPGSKLDPYSSFGLSFPFGIGFKKTVSDNIVFGIELGLRPTLTDYLDDISGYYPDFTKLAQTENGAAAVMLSDRRAEVGLDAAVPGSLRGNPNNRDWYGFLFLTIVKKMGASPCYAF